MFQITRFIHPGYLSHRLSREIKEMYWSKGISDFATAAVMLFEPIYLITAMNYTLREVMYFFAAVYLLYFFLMPLGAKIAANKGYEHAILYSSFFQILYWWLLFGSTQDNVWIYFAPLALAIQKSLFWPAFYADMARFSSMDQRGRENSGLYALISIVYIVGPVAGGFVLAEFGFATLFLFMSLIMLASNIPLFMTLEQFVPKPYNYSDTLKFYKTETRQAVGFWGFGEELTQLVIWPIFIYLTIPDFLKFGSIISVSTLIATVVMLYVGILTDQRNKAVLIRYFSVLTALFWVIRPFFNSLIGVITTNTLGTISKHSLIIPVTSLTYDRANETHIMPYLVFFEQNLVIGKLLMMLVVIIGTFFTTSFFYIFLLSAIFSLLFTKLR